MGTDIELSRIVECLPTYEQKELLTKVDKEELKRHRVTFEEIWNSLSEYEKENVFKENGEVVEEYLWFTKPSSVDQKRLIELFWDYLDLDEILSKLDDGDIISYLECHGYVVGQEL